MHLRDQEEVQAFFLFHVLCISTSPPAGDLGDELPSQLFPQVAQVEGAYVAVKVF